MWKQSLNNTVNFLPITSYHWEMKDDNHAVKWGSQEGMQNVEFHVKHYLKGSRPVPKITLWHQGVWVYSPRVVGGMVRTQKLWV